MSRSLETWAGFGVQGFDRPIRDNGRYATMEREMAEQDQEQGNRAQIVGEVMAAHKKATDGVRTVISEIEGKILCIQDIEWDRPLKDLERQKLSELRRLKGEKTAILEELGYLTVGALDRDQEVQRITHAVARAKKDLDDTAHEIQFVFGTVEVVTVTLPAVAGHLDRIQTLLGTL